MRDALLVVLCHAPVAGAAMPRLSPPLNVKQASAAYAAMLMDTEAVARSIPGTDLWFWCPDAATETLKELLSADAHLAAHSDGSVETRFVDALECGFAKGYRHVAVIRADTPDLPPAYLQTAMDRLREDANLAAFGVSLDGGVYLAGLSRPRPDLFRDVPWDHPTTWPAIRSAANRLGIPLAILPRWQTVDTFADLQDCLARGRARNLLALQANRLLTPCEEK